MNHFEIIFILGGGWAGGSTFVLPGWISRTEIECYSHCPFLNVKQPKSEIQF